MICLTNDQVTLAVLPERGGGVAKFVFAGLDIFRPLVEGNDAPTALGNFPLLPFSGRIDRGGFEAHGQQMSLKPDFADEPLHALHGHVWQAKWPGIDQQSQMLTLGYEHEPGDWPWAYRAMQTYRLTASGYSHALSIQNLGETAMPAGLGLHPYFPRENASIETDFSAIWILDSDHLPARRQTLSAPVDWFAGPTIDTGFDGLVKEVALGWPTHKLTMGLDAAFDHVVIYIPSGEAFFCVEPVSHVANAINHGGMRWLVPGETWSAFVNFGLELTGKSPWLNPACPRAWLADKPFRSQTFGYPVLVGNGFDQ